MTTPPQPLTVAALAQALGVSDKSVRDWHKIGMPSCVANPLVFNLDAAQAWVAANIDPENRGKPGRPKPRDSQNGAGRSPQQEVRLQRDLADLQYKRLKNEKARGELVNAAEVQKELTASLSRAASILRGMKASLPAQVCQALGVSDPKLCAACSEVIRRGVDRYEAELAMVGRARVGQRKDQA